MAGQDFPLTGSDPAFPVRCFLIPHHDREGLHGPLFAGPQETDCLLVGGIAAKMKTADAFNSYNTAFQNSPAGFCDGLSPADPARQTLRNIHRSFRNSLCSVDPIRQTLRNTHCSFRNRSCSADPVRAAGPAHFDISHEIDLRSAVIAADRLGVIAPGLRAVIFLRTAGAHGKFLHTGPLPVIRQGVQNGQPGTAAGAVDERMLIASVRRIFHLRFTVITDRYIGRNKYLSLCLLAFNNGELREFRFCLRILAVDLQDGGPAGRPLLQRVQESSYLGFSPLSKYLHIRTFIAYAAPDSCFHGMSGNGGPETDALYDAIDPYSFCVYSIRRHTDLLLFLFDWYVSISICYVSGFILCYVSVL